MKRSDFIRELDADGCFLKRHGKKHDIYMNPQNDKKAPVPRHSEIKNTLCEIIKNQLLAFMGAEMVLKPANMVFFQLPKINPKQQLFSESNEPKNRNKN